MSSAVDLKTKEEKDAELDRRIEALRKKNEALVKRYQEIEEDKKKAEQEGIAITTPRKPRLHEPEADRRKADKEFFTVTVDPSKPTGEKRVVNDWKPGTPRGRKTSEDDDVHRGPSDVHRGPSEGHRGPSEGHRGPSDVHRGPSEGHRGPSEGHRGPSEGHRGPSDGHSPPRRAGSGRLGRGGQRGGGRQERREWEPRKPRDGEPGEAGGQGRRGGRRGRGGEGGGEGGGTPAGVTPGGMDRKSKEWEEKRRQNIEKMNEEMERIAEYERGQRADGDKPIRNFLDDPRRSGPVPDTDRKEGSRRHVRNWGGLDFDNVKTRAELEKEWTSRRPGPKGSVDMTMSMTGRERAEYLRWKKEREQIDEERLARHRNATGQWRREWDAQKTDNMFKEDPCVTAEGAPPEQGGSRRARGRNSRVEPRGTASDDSKKPPKAPTFGDFLSQGRTQGPRGERSRGKGRGQKPSYSMHDNRWEGEKEEEGKEKEDKTKKVEKSRKEKKEEEKPKPPAAEKVEEKNGDGEEDEDEWEDASDGEEDEGSASEHDEKKDTGKEKRAKAKDSPPASGSRSRPTSRDGPKEQRTPRPKVHIPPPDMAQESPEGGKPLSPFSPLDGHQPVSDWGEEMELLSPRSSMGGESPLKPPSVESSPPQKKEPEEETENRAEPAEEEEAARTDVSPPPGEIPAQTVIVSEPECIPSEPSASSALDTAHSEAPDPTHLETTDSAHSETPDPAHSESPDPPHSDVPPPAPSEASEAAVDQDTPGAPSQSQEDQLDAPPSASVPEADQNPSEPAGGTDGDLAPAVTITAPSADPGDPSEQPASG